MESLTSFITKSESRRLKIAVIGDSMIDEYYSVRVNRISPEFPIPVLLSENDLPSNIVPGGAANVCQQMKYWNTDVYLISAVTPCGIPVLATHNVNYDFSVTLLDWQMPRKKRFYDGDFPLDRWDVESGKSNTKTEEWVKARSKLLDKFIYMVDNVKPDIVILSDYGKGIFVNGLENISQKIIKICNELSIPTIVDPKSTNKDFWQNCTTIKPNADWARSFCDKYDPEFKSGSKWESEMKFISDMLNCKEVVLTDSGNGVGILDRDLEPYFSPSPSLSKNRPIIRSVIGAGDCFCAFFTMAKSLGFNLKSSVKIAFNGASAYIEDKHNSPVTPYRFGRWFDPIRAKVVSLEQLVEIKKQSPGKTWIWTNGCFDIMHEGHIKTFEEAKKLGDKLIVGINTDESVRMLKGDSRPILNYKSRETLVANMQYVDFVVPISDKTPEKMIQQISPNKIVKGGDYRIKDIHGWDVVGEDNVHLVELVDTVSTSKIIERIKNE